MEAKAKTSRKQLVETMLPLAVASLVLGLFERLVPLAQEAFDARHYSTAYHLLAAALHEAADEPQHCATVQRLAEEQLAEIDAAHPAYEHSSRSAATRGHVSIFALLARQAYTKLVMAQQGRQGEVPPAPHEEHVAE
jgi:hypothetical protein